MVEGQPLHYYHQYPAIPQQDQFPFFRHFDPYHPRMDHSEDLMPSSPNSTQSDSDNSVSSIEISRKEIGLSTNIIKNTDKSEVQCRWRSCGIFFPSLDQLSAHLSKVHSSSGLGGLFYCGWEGCSRNDKGFNARYKMLVHVRTHTNEKPHKCFQCDKSFSRAENLKIHSRSHSGEKPYLCPVPGCNKAYSNSSDRFKHTRTHQVEKPYQCKVPGCSKRYTDPSSLRKHVKTYKHFVVESDGRPEKGNIEDSKNKESLASQTTPEERIPTYGNSIESVYRENVIKHPCDCNRVCCVSNCISSASDLFRIGALLNLKNESNSWNNFIDISEKQKMYTSYETVSQEHMDIDAPLDLSVHRRNY